MVVPALLVMAGCDDGSRGDCPPAASATTSVEARQEKSPKRPFKLPGVTKLKEKTYGLKTDSIVALLTYAFESGARATKLPGAGYRLDSVPPGSPLEQLGLMTGDEVRAIAEITLTSPQSLYRAFRAAKDRTLFHLQGRRGGKPLRINYLLADAQPSCPPCEQAEVEDIPPLDEKARQAIRRGIVKQPDGSYRVSSKVVDTILDNQAHLMRSARIVPVTRGDRVVGLRLFAVRPDSFLARLGLQNGDMLLSLNGLPVTDPQKALEAYKQVRAAKRVDLTIERQSKELTLTYRIGP